MYYSLQQLLIWHQTTHICLTDTTLAVIERRVSRGVSCRGAGGGGGCM